MAFSLSDFSAILGLPFTGSPATQQMRQLAQQALMGQQGGATQSELAPVFSKMQSLYESTPEIQQWVGNRSDLQQTFQQQPTSPSGPTAPTTPTTPTGTSPVDPNKPLSTPGTPVNQATAPSDINPYIPATSQQQQDIVNQAIKQSQGLAGDNLTQLRGILDPYIQQQFQSFTDPKGSQYQSTIGQLNNVGMADSGAFPQALADKLAPLLSQGAYQLGEQTLIPSFLNQQNLVGQGAQVQSNLGLDSLQRFIEEQNFQQQGDLAKQLASQGASAQFGSGIGGLLGGGLGAAGGGLLGGLPGAFIGSQLGSQGGQAIGGGGGLSWICGHLKKLKLATEDEVERVHIRLRPSIFRHPIHWLHYLYNAPRLITLADQAGADWQAVKEILVDAVLAEPDPESAWQIYRAECESLCARYAPELWKLESTVCR